MTFQPRSRDTIRDSLLSNQQTEFRLIGKELLVVPGSDPYIEAQGIAMELEGLEAEASDLRKQIFPRSAATQFLVQHGDQLGLPRNSAVNAQLVFTVTGVVDGVYPLGASTMIGPNGLTYQPAVTNVTIVSGTDAILFTCTSPGATGTLAVGATAQWSSAPAGLGNTGAVASVTTNGEDAEDDTEYAARVEERMAFHPGSANNADWKQWVTAVDGVDTAYVLSLCQPNISTTQETLGTTTVVPFGPAAGDTPTQPSDAFDTKFLSFDAIARIEGYIEGENDIHGVTVEDGVILRPTTIKPESYVITDCVKQHVDILIQITVTSRYSSTVPTLPRVSSTTTTLVVVGDHSDLAGQDAQIWLGTAYVRGGHKAITITTAVYSAPNTTLSFVAQPVAPTNDTGSACLRPRPSNWNSCRLKIFALIDSRGPAAGVFARHPRVDRVGRATLEPSEIVAALMPQYVNGVLVSGVDGVTSVTVAIPAAVVSPPVLTVLTLDQLHIVQA